MNDRITHDNRDLATVPYIVYESAIMKRDIIFGRLHALLTITLATLLVSLYALARARMRRR